MFDKMVKMKNKKGFTLVEMLVVIAVIAILVSIVIPVVGNSTQKSRAATNAANLRSIEGQISTMRVENPELFEDAVDKLGQQLGGLKNFIDLVMDLFGLSSEDLITGNNEFSQYVNYKVAHSTADDNGTLTFNIGDGQTITIENVPTAKGVSVPGMEVAEGTHMTVYLSDTEIMATYESGSNSFTRMDFAEVAETGEFSGEKGSGGLTEEDATGDLACAVGYSHKTDDNCVCQYCKQTIHTADNRHTCEKCGALVRTAHVDYNGDNKCDYYNDCTVSKVKCSCTNGTFSGFGNLDWDSLYCTNATCKHALLGSHRTTWSGFIIMTPKFHECNEYVWPAS